MMILGLVASVMAQANPDWANCDFGLRGSFVGGPLPGLRLEPNAAGCAGVPTCFPIFGDVGDTVPDPLGPMQKGQIITDANVPKFTIRVIRRPADRTQGIYQFILTNKGANCMQSLANWKITAQTGGIAGLITGNNANTLFFRTQLLDPNANRRLSAYDNSTDMPTMAPTFETAEDVTFEAEPEPTSAPTASTPPVAVPTATTTPTGTPAPTGAFPTAAPNESPGMGHDPHVYTSEGHVVDIYLPLGEWVEMIRGPSTTLLGHVFARNGTLQPQWFDGIALVSNADKSTLINASIPHDVPLGEVGPEIQYLALALAGQRLTETNKTYEHGDITLQVGKLDSAIRGGRSPILNDIVHVASPDFDFKIYIARETDRDNYDSLEEQFAETHLDFKFTSVPHPAGLAGPVAEIMWPASHTLSDQARAFMTKP